MFVRRKRLTRTTFPAALSTGRRVSSAHFTAVLSKEDKDLPAGRQGYAVVVSKKTARLSVARHRIKRRALEALRTLHLPHSVILYPRASVLTMGYDELRQELMKLLS